MLACYGAQLASEVVTRFGGVTPASATLRGMLVSFPGSRPRTTGSNDLTPRFMATCRLRRSDTWRLDEAIPSPLRCRLAKRRSTLGTRRSMSMACCMILTVVGMAVGRLDCARLNPVIARAERRSCFAVPDSGTRGGSVGKCLHVVSGLHMHHLKGNYQSHDVLGRWPGSLRLALPRKTYGILSLCAPVELGRGC